MQQPEEGYSVSPSRKNAPREDDGRGEFVGNLLPLAGRCSEIVPPHPSEPIVCAAMAPTSELRETANVYCRKANQQTIK